MALTAQISAARFNPYLDAFSEVGTPLMYEWRRGQLRNILLQAQERALSLAERDFGLAVHLCPIRKACEELIAGGELDPLLAAAGDVFVSLDHFFARTTPPPLSSHAKLRWAVFSAKRSFDFFMANGVELLAFAGVLRAVPERWLPSELLNLDLSRRFGNTVLFENVRCEAFLPPQMPGGIQWLKNKSLEHFAVMERQCPQAPMPFVLLLRDFDCLHALILIANSCSRKNENEFRLRCCDVKDAASEMELLLDLSDWGSQAVTVCGKRGQVVGLIRVRYAPCLPPLGSFQKLLGVVGLRRLFWRIKRFARGFLG
jgi:hypothetical protein